MFEVAWISDLNMSSAGNHLLRCIRLAHIIFLGVHAGTNGLDSSLLRVQTCIPTTWSFVITTVTPQSQKHSANGTAKSIVVGRPQCRSECIAYVFLCFLLGCFPRGVDWSSFLVPMYFFGSYEKRRRFMQISPRSLNQVAEITARKESFSHYEVLFWDLLSFGLGSAKPVTSWGQLECLCVPFLSLKASPAASFTLQVL